MKESYSECLASHTGPELYADDGDIVGVATTGGHAGQVLSSTPFPATGHLFRVPTSCCDRKAISGVSPRQDTFGHGGVRDLEHVWKLQTREPGRHGRLECGNAAPVGFHDSPESMERSVNTEVVPLI